ncbi:MAG TPA: tetratricopeptide repeat protein [Woeseiaceae bacterium]|nr:tetratricopeptide repeat protein [Woeseiaceae bacterium]
MFLRIRDYLISIAAAAMVALAASPAAFAQEDEDESRQSAPTISQRTGEKLNEAIEFLNNDDYASARAVLADIDLEDLSPYERSRVEQIWSGIEYSEGNYAAAREHLQQAINAGGFSDREISQAKYQIAQIYMAEEKWEQGAAALEEWFRSTPQPNASAYYLLAAAYYQMEDLEAALEPAKKAVEMSDDPQASWIELLLALYLTRENYDAALPLMERLLLMEPQEKTHWLRLSSLYQTQEQYAEALAALQIAYNAGFLEQPSEYQRLSDMLRFNDIPYRAARVLKRALENENVEADSETYEKLANAWIQARDFDEAIPPLTRAAELSDNGDLFMRLGQVQIQREQWQEAVDALQEALNKGDLEDPGQANLLMGIALFNLERLSDAREYFQRAARSEEHRGMASDYIKLIDSKRAR